MVILMRVTRQTRRTAGLDAAVRGIARDAGEIAERYADMGMDHAGELFNKVMGNQASDGAYFTIPTCAVMLAELGVEALDETDWANPATWRKERSGVFDPTCGSGTLLVAWGEAVKRRARAAGAGPAEIEKLHRRLVEETLMGLDINAVSLQLAGSQLTLGDARVQYKHMNLWKMPYGCDSGSGEGEPAKAGTLELLADKRISGCGDEPQQHGLKLEEEDRTYKGADGATRLALREDEPGRRGELELAIEEIQGRKAAIMNPPFVTRKKLGERLGRERQLAVRGRIDGLQRVLDLGSPQLKDICGKTTSRPLYVGLGLNCIDGNDGVLATVIPTTGLLGPSGQREREILATELHIRQVVSFHEPGYVNVSQMTDSNESLVIGTRNGRNKNRPTMFVSFERRPRTPEEMRKACDAITRGEAPESAAIRYVAAERMRRGDWSAAGWCANKLDEAIEEMEGWRELKRFDELKVGMETVGHSSYTDKPGLGARRKLLNKKGEDGQTRLRGKPDSVLRLKNRRGSTEPERRRHEDSLWRQQVRDYGAYLFIVRGGDPASTRVNAVACERKQVGMAWKPIQGLNLQQSKAIAVWLNSTPGRLQLMTIRGGERLGWPALQPEGFRRVRVPKPGDEEMMSTLSAAFDRHADETVPRFDDGYGPLRQALDEAVVKAIPSADAGKIRQWAELLAEEPVCTGRAKD